MPTPIFSARFIVGAGLPRPYNQGNSQIKKRKASIQGKTEPKKKRPPSTESSAPSTIFTLGHSTRSLEDFLRLLRAHGVERLVDIRSIPRSQHNPQFNREALSRFLRSRRIGYRHMKPLGGLRHAHRDSLNKGWRNASFRGFADYMQTSEFEKALETLIDLSRQKKTAILCAEAVPWRCHRSLVADALTARGLQVKHIFSPAKAEPHRVSQMARMSGNRVTYPAERGQA